MAMGYARAVSRSPMSLKLRSDGVQRVSGSTVWRNVRVYQTDGRRAVAGSSSLDRGENMRFMENATYYGR
jgi:hypothetical protein